MTEITTLLGQYVFPIVMCLIMAWYVKDQSDKHSEAIEKLNAQHREEVESLTKQYREQNDNMVEAVSNNTQAIIQLTEVIRNDKD